MENDLAYQAGKALGKGFVGFISGIATSSINLYKNNLIENSEDNYEEDDELQEGENYNKFYEIENETSTREKKETKWWFMYFGFLIVMIGIAYFMFFWYSTPKEGETKISINAKDYIGVQYTEVEEKFINMGFSNIKSVPKEDLIFGWFNKEGLTAKITINNNDNFKKDEIFPKDADIIIYYHSFKK